MGRKCLLCNVAEEAFRESAGKHRPGREPIAPPKTDVTTTKLDGLHGRARTSDAENEL
jgi:hypothetical protein